MRAALSLLLILAPGLALAQRPVEYEISFPNAIHHEAEVSAVFADVPAGPLQVRMSRSSPGRYALHEFAKNVYSVRATDGQGRPLRVTRPNPHQWDVQGHDGTVRFQYTLFGDRTDGTYTGIDNTHAHLNMPATFAWARGLEQRPVTVTFRRPDPKWKIATQLRPSESPERFTAPHLQYFMDSPTELSDHAVRSWTVGSGARRDTIRLAVHHLGTEQEMDAFAEMVRKVVAEQIAVFGEAPEFDFGSYTFIADYLPWADGDGMEHRNSTILTSTRPLSTGALGNLGTVSHEFFHAWNVERIRPRSLEPFSFEEANMSSALWFAEGFTQYYTPLFLRRAGLIADADYARSVAGTLNAVVNGPGRKFFSPAEMSMQAPFVDAAVSIDPTNRENTFISYYTGGAGVGLGLDLTLRGRFDLTLDDYMRAVWQAYGKPQADFTPQRPYTLDDLRAVLGQVTRDPAFADDFFRRYVDGREVPDYEALLARAGMQLRKANAGRAWIGAPEMEAGEGGVVLAGPTRIGTPLYDAGLDRGGRILSLDGRPVRTPEEVAAAVAARRPGDEISIDFEQRAERRSARLRLAEDPRLEVVLVEDAGQPLPRAARAFREAWLGSRAR